MSRDLHSFCSLEHCFGSCSLYRVRVRLTAGSGILAQPQIVPRPGASGVVGYRQDKRVDNGNSAWPGAQNLYTTKTAAPTVRIRFPAAP